MEACPPSPAYRLHKFARRHKAQFAAVATIAVVLVLGTLISSCLAAWALCEQAASRVNLTHAKQNEAIAKKERTDALNARELSEQAEQLAKEQERIARQQRNAAEYELYAASVRLANYDWLSGEPKRLIKTLDELAPKPGRPDFRGWEWYYLFSQAHSERFALPMPLHSTVLAWSPNTNDLAATDRISLVNIWDASTGRLRKSLGGCPNGIWSLSWLSDGKQIAAAGDRGAIVIWDVASGHRTRLLRGHATRVQCLASSRDGRWLASGGTDGTIHIWDTAAGERRSSLYLGAGKVTTLDWHPDNQQLLAVGDEGAAGSRD